MHSTPSDSCPSSLIGQSFVVASQLQDSVGKIVVPLTKDMIPIGHLTGNKYSKLIFVDLWVTKDDYTRAETETTHNFEYEEETII